MAKKEATKRAGNEQVGLQLRFRENVRSRLQSAAELSGNSMNAEIIERLVRTLEEDQFFGPQRNRAFFVEAATQIAHAESYTGEKWNEDAATYWAARRLVMSTFDRFTPKPEDSDLRLDLEVEVQNLRKERQRLICELDSRNAIRPARREDYRSTDHQDRPYEKIGHDYSGSGFEDEAATMERALVDVLLQEFDEVTEKLSEAQAALREMGAPNRETRERGEGIAATIQGCGLDED